MMNTMKSNFKEIAITAKHSFLMVLFVVLCMQVGFGQANKRRELKEQITSLRKSNKFSEKDTLHIQLLIDLGKEMRYIRPDSFLSLSEEALGYSKNIKYVRGQSESYLGMGGYYSDQGKSTAAINNFNKGLILAQDLANYPLYLRFKNNLATEYNYIGDYAQALNNYLEGIELAELHGEKKMLSVMNENIAGLYIALKDYEHAMEFYKEVQELNNELDDEVSSAMTESNLASLFAEMGTLDHAMFYVNRSIATLERHKVLDWLAYAYEIKGKVYLKQGKFQWALYWYHQSESLHEEIDDPRSKIDLLNGMAEAYFGQSKEDLSEKYALEAYDISTRINFAEGTQKCAKTLYKINKNKKNYGKSLRFHEIYLELSDTLQRNENQKSLTLLKTRSEYDQQKTTLIEENKKALAKQRGLIYAALIVLVIFAIITFFIKRAERIQKTLNKELKIKKAKLEKHEVELQESNDTKTKLFSIIGHDLRGPIGALQGLLQMFTDGEVNKSEFFEFIPKLKSDVDHIYFTLSNLLSWGQTQMNGSTMKPMVLPLESIVNNNIDLLSQVAKTKSIKIISKLAGNTNVWSDSNQVDIVIRNLISNALKFTPDNGMITISSREKNDLWEVSIRDTGVGMDKITMEKLFKKDSSFTTYGTNNEKGTGLGLSLCKEMVEKNGGTIWVESTLRKGSTFYFTLPKAKSKYSQAS